MQSHDEKNPLATDGFEFVEFSAPDDAGMQSLDHLFQNMGFSRIAEHKRKKVTLYRQGNINFIVNQEDHGYFHQFAKTHGPCACAMAFRVKNAENALKYAISQGARRYDQIDIRSDEAPLAAIYGIGNSVLYFIDRYAQKSIYDQDFNYLPNIDLHPTGLGLKVIDHLTHNVCRGNMDVWANFYQRIANFREIRYFDIEGKSTGLHSRAMTSPCGKIRIPINESADDHSQIEEYLHDYKGEGIQHIALSTEDIYQTVANLRAAGISFLSTPDTYFDRVNSRVPGHGENLALLRDLNILIDGNPISNEGILLQIFTQTVVGPIFFEIIQRKGNEGFGEGNFQALFDSIEEDQFRRGIITPDKPGTSDNPNKEIRHA